MGSTGAYVPNKEAGILFCVKGSVSHLTLGPPLIVTFSLSSPPLNPPQSVSMWNYQNYENQSHPVNCESSFAHSSVFFTVSTHDTLTGWCQINQLMHILFSHKLWIRILFPLGNTVWGPWSKWAKWCAKESVSWIPVSFLRFFLTRMCAIDSIYLAALAKKSTG